MVVVLLSLRFYTVTQQTWVWVVYTAVAWLVGAGRWPVRFPMRSLEFFNLPNLFSRIVGLGSLSL
jgi:hypothetical protein